MPFKIFLNLELEKEIDSSFLKPDGIHGIFFTILGKESAKILHEDFKNLKPFSLFCKELFKNEPTKVLYFEINILKDNLAPQILSDLILGNAEGNLNINGKKVGYQKQIKTFQKHIKTYESFLENENLPKKVEIKFIKPTTFRRNNIDFPFPLPELVFKGLIKKWLAFSGIKPNVDLRDYYQFVEISKYNLKTRKVEFANGGKLTAFEGYVTYNFDSLEGKREVLNWFNILLNYAVWSGVGRKTTMGLGKVWIQPKEF
jgi:CRISPR-associated endoribonuclease Cas6